MIVKELIGALRRFPADAEVRLGISWPDRVTETYERLWVGDYGGGPQINTAMDFKGVNVYVGCTLQQRIKDRPVRKIDLGRYDSPEIAAKIRDFFIVHRGLDEPLNFPDFDYDRWIPPRTTSGDYNQHIAEILKKKLLSE